MDEAGVLERLVAAYSPSGSEAPGVRAFLSVAGALGYAARADKAGNGIARLGRGRPHVMFLGHIDTVEGALPVRRARGRVYGRGAVDAKGPLAAALLAGPLANGGGTYTVVAAVGEETDSRGARYCLSGPRPDFVVAGEPSGWDGVTIGYKGEVRLTATFRGNRTHYSSPEPTAMDRAVDWVAGARAIAEEHRGASSFRSMTAKVVDLESERVGGRETARATVDCRLPPGVSADSVLARLRALPGGPSLAVSIRVEPLEVPPSNPVVRALVEGIRREGGRPTLWQKGGTSDLNLVAPVWNVPGAAYGPGDARLDHTDRESVPVRDVARAARVLATALGRLGVGAPTSPRSVAGA